MRLVVVAFPVTMPANENEATNAAASTTPSDTNVVATNTVAISEISPQENVGLEVQSTQDFRSAASVVSDQHREEVFSETPQTLPHVADKIQNAPSNSLKSSSREVKNLCSVNNTGRKESLVLSDNGRQKRPNLNAAQKKYEDALSKVNQELKEFLETYPKNVHVPVEERSELKARYKKLTH